MTAPVLFLVVRSGPAAGRVFEVDRQGVRLGRDETCEVRLRDPLVSKLHAEIFVDLFSATFTIRDLRSRNGIQVNGRSVTEANLEAGDELRIGRSRIEVTAASPENRIEGASRSLTALAELARLALEVDPLDSLDAYADRLREATAGCGAAIAVYEEGADKPIIEVYSDINEAFGAKKDTAKMGRPPPGQGTGPMAKSGIVEADEVPLPDIMSIVAQTKQPCLVADVKERADLAADPDVRKGVIQACLGLPLIVEGEFLGVAQIYWSEPGCDSTTRAASEAGASLIALALKRAL